MINLECWIRHDIERSNKPDMHIIITDSGAWIHGKPYNSTYEGKWFLDTRYNKILVTGGVTQLIRKNGQARISPEKFVYERIMEEQFPKSIYDLLKGQEWRFVDPLSWIQFIKLDCKVIDLNR